MTSAVLTDTAPAEDSPDPVPMVVVVVDETVRHRLAPKVGPDRWSWVAAAVVTFIAGALRLVGITHPTGKIFDEIYYATEGQELFDHGVEWQPDGNYGDFVVHPPLGKWIIGAGEWLFGRDAHGHWLVQGEFGWRISAALFGTLSVLILVRLARRLFGSTVLGCAAGLLLALDGMHFVLSRSALLDIFLMFFILAAFACLVLDRDRRRAGWLAALEAGLDPSAPGRGARPSLGVPWWRLAAGVLIGCACSVKWSGLAYVALFVVLIFLWEGGARRSAGARHPWRDTLLDETGWVLAFLGLAVAVYLASWSGWFATDTGWDRHWLHASHHAEPRIIGPLINLWHYHQEALNFHEHLTQSHPYQSWPFQWLVDYRPVAFYWSSGCSPGMTNCASEVLLLGTPLLWWSFLPALFGLSWLGIARRDWRALAIGLGAVMGIVPWFKYELDDRTMFYFYALPAEPFLILAVVYVLAAIIGPRPARGAPLPERRLIGTIVAATFVLLVAWCFAFYYPIYVGSVITWAEWNTRMWLGTWV